MKKIICLILGVGLIGMSSAFYFLTPFPKQDSIPLNYPIAFSIDKENLFETQLNNECSAFSLSYILRHFGEQQTGLNLYQELNYKLPVSGYVLPKGIIHYFKNSNYSIEMFTGTLESLKTRLAEGTPIIVLVGQSFNWQHYMTLVGYDSTSDELYFFDSLKINDENGEQPGNRTLKTNYFLSLWDNGLPIFHQLYFVIRPQ